ncbi:MAG: hypothetical protein ABJA90_06840 [Ginsengibacter sp.]
MSNFPILDLVVGIIFVYFLLSIITSSAVEMILTGLKARAVLLEEWLFRIFDKTVTQPDGTKLSLGQAIMDHCSITSLSPVRKSNSYIDSKNFASALLEKITFDPANPKAIPKDFNELIASIEKSDALSTEFQRVLIAYATEAQDTFESLTEKTVSKMELFRAKIENWFDSSMSRMTGSLKKRYSRPATLIVAIVVTAFLNADSIALAKYLYRNPDARAKIAMQAYDATKDPAFINQAQKISIGSDTASNGAATAREIKNDLIKETGEINKAKQELDDVMPLTWKAGELNNATGKFSALLFFSKITGLLATILAIMMGAPFWFDLLNKISNMRSTGAKPAVSASEEDRKK